MNNIQSDNTFGATLHNPVRQPDETQEAYKARRKESNAQAKENSQIGQGGKTTRELTRNQIRNEGRMKYFAGSYGRGLRNWITQKQAAELANKGK